MSLKKDYIYLILDSKNSLYCLYFIFMCKFLARKLLRGNLELRNSCIFILSLTEISDDVSEAVSKWRLNDVQKYKFIK